MWLKVCGTPLSHLHNCGKQGNNGNREQLPGRIFFPGCQSLPGSPDRNVEQIRLPDTHGGLSESVSLRFIGRRQPTDTMGFRLSSGVNFRLVEGQTKPGTVTNWGLDRAPGRACRRSGRELSSAQLSGRADQAEFSDLVSRHRRCSIFARSPIPAIFDTRVAVPGDVPSDGAEVLPGCRGKVESQTCKTGQRMVSGVGDSPHVPKCPIVTGRVTYLRATDPPIDQGRLSVRASLISKRFRPQSAALNEHISHQRS